MAKRKSVEERLAAAIQEMGLERAEAAFRILKSYTTKPEPKTRKKHAAVGVQQKEETAA